MRIRPVLIVALVCWAAATAATFAVRVDRADESYQTLSAVIPAADLTHLDLSAPDGSVDLQSIPDSAADQVTVSVALRSANRNRWQKPVVPSAAALLSDPGGHVLRLGVRGVNDAETEADWTITVPARFSARVGMHRGRVAIAGIGGGVEVSLDSGLHGAAGAILAEVPGGRLDLELGVGHIEARTAARAYGEVDLHATVGGTQLFLDGHEVRAPKAPGPGQRLRLEGEHANGLSLRVTVGTAQLRIR